MRLLTCLFLCLSALAVPVYADDQRPPNIVFMFADDLGYGDLGCYGHPYMQTPNLDRLAEQGTRFTQAYVTGITCNPSRTGYMTGKFPASFARYTADFGFGKRITITELLKEKGYATGHFGKWHIGPVKKNGTYGIDRIASGKRSAELGRDAGLYGEAINFIRENKDKPFYINVWGHITHYPVNPPAHFAERFKDETVDLDKFGPTMQEKYRNVKQLGKDFDAGMRNYLGDVASLDDMVGQLLKALDEEGLADNTIVVFSSDHGAAPVKLNKKDVDNDPDFSANMLGSAGPFRGGKHTTLEGGVRVPFIIRWPGKVPANKVDEDSVISGIDWLPTLCSIAGIEIDADDFDGEDVSAAWLGKQAHERVKPLFWRNSAKGAAITMRMGQWKLFFARKGREVQLFDLNEDPLEQDDLAEQHPKVVKQMREQAEAWAATLPKDYKKLK